MSKNIVIALILSMVFSSCSQKKKTGEDTTLASENSFSKEMYMLVGTYTSPEGSKGIYVYRFDSETGKTDSISMVEVGNPSYLTLSTDEKFVYSVTENGKDDSKANAFSFDKKNGKLTLLNSQNTSSADPCYIETDKAGKNIFTADYSGGSISAFIANENGSLSSLSQQIQFTGKGTDPQRQTQSHIHSVRYSPDGKYLFATDLGLDKIYRYTPLNSVFEGQPLLSVNDMKSFEVPAETGPRHFDFHPNGKFFYLLGELSGQVIVFDYNDGDLSQKQAVAADTVNAKGSADLHISPDGKFIYASNRLKNNGIAIFSINPDDGTLTKVGYQPTGIHPRNFVITPDGNFLLVACRDSNKTQVFKRDTDTGLLSDTSQDILLNKPVCLKFAGM